MMTSTRSQAGMKVSSALVKAYIALGSNMGDRLSMLEQSLDEMEARNIHVLRTSSLYETAPMYVTDQDVFLNGICEVETTLSPIELLDALQSIENEMGRVKLIDKGPRVIDLDIVLYDDIVYSDKRLDIPHKLMLEREFVLRPLCQLIPHEKPPIPDLSLSYQEILERLPISYPRPISMTPVSASYPTIKASDPARQTHVMAVLNVTPDSFSDGGLHSPKDLETLAEAVRDMIRSGATIIDVGGESTRPTSVPVGADEEIRRALVFAKTHKQNLTLLRNGQALRAFEGLSDIPWLVGTSRKSFIGKITGIENPVDRTWGTAASVTAAIQGGADIIRIHDVKEMVQVTTMADAIYRTSSA
ncbi:7,8-Dihydro-6-hydroxymethylpterin-pyrophosphokinase, HPPK [Ascosphaera apis ARSEF 7405]|uniref:2-amino-4-hydroxy-6-hydroxymethyldihydropteridine diphosphokinase n=1 Tax=Ascosphaera apis ARSEF 7405 TaxID=392613 RepID=A0A167WUK3_9EURO|nr:7,8-Dihydro-6-hydroxymethylpterin-pyrophosphokinase, HPPK [Ascosphaera apis ARSEF 7405]